jgi:hypothetical protein
MWVGRWVDAWMVRRNCGWWMDWWWMEGWMVVEWINVLMDKWMTK